MAYYDRDYFQAEQRPRGPEAPPMGKLSKSLLILLGVLFFISLPIADSANAAAVLTSHDAPELLRALALSVSTFGIGGEGVAPWQVITAPLVPAGIFSAIMTAVFGLWLFGCRLEQALGRRRYGLFLLVALPVCGVASAVVDPLVATLWMEEAELRSLGTLPLTTAIFMAAAAAYPGVKTLFNLKFTTVAMVCVGLSALLALVGYTEQVDGVRVVDSLPGMAAGAAFGWYGIKWMARRGMVKTVAAKREVEREDYLAFASQFSGSPAKPTAAEEKSPETARRERELRRQTKQAVRESEEQEEVDRLLGRISAEGINSLSKGERAFLERVSRRKRESGK